MTEFMIKRNSLTKRIIRRMRSTRANFSTRNDRMNDMLTPPPLPANATDMSTSKMLVATRKKSNEFHLQSSLQKKYNL
jgi:hypothetical protein